MICATEFSPIGCVRSIGRSSSMRRIAASSTACTPTSLSVRRDEGMEAVSADATWNGMVGASRVSRRSDPSGQFNVGAVPAMGVDPTIRVDKPTLEIREPGDERPLAVCASTKVATFFPLHRPSRLSGVHFHARTRRNGAFHVPMGASEVPGESAALHLATVRGVTAWRMNTGSARGGTTARSCPSWPWIPCAPGEACARRRTARARAWTSRSPRPSSGGTGFTFHDARWPAATRSCGTRT